jgi:hypothetical protein
VAPGGTRWHPAAERPIGLNERPPLERFLAEKDQLLKDEKLPDENKLYID